MGEGVGRAESGRGWRHEEMKGVEKMRKREDVVVG